ncbi:MAG: hypothetical protein JW812_01900 [Alphaproteobacteria bacterium]|nr:hypothetical protein [Alphaproteobacteria bacterium]MBN2779917.1 hypothetical protein [Alphaproteobacteria bacterium]
MRKYLIFSIFVLVASMVMPQESFAERSGGTSARRAKGATSPNRTRINVGRTAGVTGVLDNKDSLTGATNTSTFTTEAATTTLDNQQCVNSITQCLSADNLCGSGLFKCKDVFADGAALLADSRGQSCSDKLTSCQCYYANDPAVPLTDCAFVWDQAVLQIQDSGYDMGQCQSKFMTCAKTECSGANYSACVDLIDTAINSAGADDEIDTQDFLRNWLNDSTDPSTTALSTGLRGLLMQRLARCEADVLTQCQDYDPLIPAANVTADNTISRTLNYFFQDFARKASEGLIDYQETHAKDKWLKAEACVNTVDQCMAKHCGDGYKKCLHEDSTVDFVAANNFRTLCQTEMITCSEIRVEVGLPGYQFLQNPAVDGVEAVWNEFISKKLLAHGNKAATDRRELERELDIKIANAQRECELSGGEFGYTQEALLNYQVKFGSQTDDYKGDSGLLNNKIMDHDGDGVPDVYPSGTDTTPDSTVYGAQSNANSGGGEKMQRFYDRPTCMYTVVLQRAHSIMAKASNDRGRVKVDMRQNGVKCNEMLFPEALKGESNIWAGVLGGVIGGAAGVVGGQVAIQKEEQKNLKTAGLGVAGTGGGILAGTAIQRAQMMKKLSCAVENARRDVNGDLIGSIGYIPVAKFGESISLPPVNVTETAGAGRKAGVAGRTSSGTSTMLNAFDAVDEFYRAHPELVVQRGEYNAN